MAEIEDSYLSELQRTRELHTRLFNNPKTRAQYEKLAKEVNPQAVTTEEELAPFTGPMAERLSKLEAFEAKIEKSSKQWEQNEKLQTLRNQYGFTDDGVNAVQKLMDENKLSDPLEAARLFSTQFRPKAADASNYGGSWGNGRMGMSKEEASNMVENPNAWADEEMFKILQETN